MRCKLSLRQIEKYTAELWPTPECPYLKQTRLATERARAATMTALMVRAALANMPEQFEAAVMALRSLMEEE